MLCMYIYICVHLYIYIYKFIYIWFMIVYTVYMIMRVLEVKNIFHTTKPQSPASSKLEWCWKRQAARNAEYEISCDASAVNLRTWSSMQREREELQVMNTSCPEGSSCKLGFKQLYDSVKPKKYIELKSGDHQLRLVVYPIFFRLSYTLGGFSLDFSQSTCHVAPPGWCFQLLPHHSAEPPVKPRESRAPF